jgi:hypothetical protein
MTLSENNIEKIKTYLINKPVLKAYLFGSQVSGKVRESSDVDLLVELDYFQKSVYNLFKCK